MVEAPMAESAPDTLLSVEGLEAGYGEVQVLWGLSLKARRGKLTAIVGANGAGKTTTLRAVAGTLTPWGGRVTLDGEDVTRVPSHVKAARGLALVPEGRQLFSMMSVAENLELGAFSPRGSRSYAERLEQVFKLFPRLAERARQRAGTLSGGEQQMVAIARGLMSHRRAIARARAGGRLPAARDIEAAQAKRPDDFAGRAERASGAGGQRLCLCCRRGPHLHRGPAGGTHSESGNPARLFGIVNRALYFLSRRAGRGRLARSASKSSEGALSQF
jgi:ABC-type lipoprotein export system ATPase subunit